MNETPSSSAHGYVMQVQSGNASRSRLGFRMRESLGKDLYAIAILEGGLELDTGALTLGGRMWGRQSYVGFEGRFGRLTAGRQMTLLNDFDLVFDPTGIRYSSPMLDPVLIGRADNALKWTHSFDGISLAVLHSFGTEAVGSNMGRLTSASARERMRSVDLSLVLERRYGNTAVTADAVMHRKFVGAVWALSENSKLYASLGKRTVGTAVGPASTDRMGWVGWMVQPTEILSASVALYRLKSDRANSDASAIVGFGSYRFSKSSDIYVQLGIVANDTLADIGVTGPGTANAGSVQRGISGGVQYRF